MENAEQDLMTDFTVSRIPDRDNLQNLFVANFTLVPVAESPHQVKTKKPDDIKEPVLKLFRLL